MEGFYDWVFASAWHMWMDERNNRNWSDLSFAKANPKYELSVYEGGNYHSTFSTPGDAPMERINAMNAGKAGGVSAVNSMLILLKEYGARTQQNFNLSQHQFSPAGAFGNLPAAIRGWGGILNIGDAATQRFRPRFIALETANKVIGGDLVATEQTGANPTFSVENRFGAGYGPSKNPKLMMVEGVPRIHSYGFREGDRRGLILVSNDPRQAQAVTVEFAGAVRDGTARAWWVEGAGLEANNELDWAPEPEVTMAGREIPWRSGASLQLAPGTLMAIEWVVE